MKERLLEKFRRLAESRSAFDPGVFSDPLAGQTGWSPLKSGGTNFTTYRLVREGDRLEFPKDSCWLKEIHALQIIAERVRGG